MEVVKKELVNFANFIGYSSDEIESLDNNDDSEILLKKLLVSQTKDVGQYICSLLDPMDVNRMHIDTGGQVWNYSQSHPLPPQFYKYIFENCQINSENLAKDNQAFGDFKKILNINNKDDKTLLRLFHCINLKNIKSEIKDMFKNEPFIGDEIYDKIQCYKQEFEGPSRNPFKDDLASLWIKQISFPFFQSKDVIIKNDTKKLSKEDEQDNGKNINNNIKDIVFSKNDNNVEFNLQNNKLVKYFCNEFNVPLTYPKKKVAQQIVLLTTSKDPDRISNSLNTLLHRDQSFEHMFEKTKELKSKFDNNYFEEVVKYIASQIQDLPQKINESPEFREFFKSKNLKEPQEVSQFFSEYLFTQENLGKYWIKTISTL
jgi:hypothetical protein